MAMASSPTTIPSMDMTPSNPMGVRCRALADAARTPLGADYTPRIKGPAGVPASAAGSQSIVIS